METQINNINKAKEYVINNKLLMDEWDWESNETINLDPSKITFGSEKKPYWMCQYGHNRNRGRGCLECAKNKNSQYKININTYGG